MTPSALSRGEKYHSLYNVHTARNIFLAFLAPTVISPVSVKNTV